MSEIRGIKNRCYFKLTGESGLFEGIETVPGRGIEAQRYEYEMTMPYDKATGQVTGMRSVSPFYVTIPKGPDTAQCIQALCQAENCPEATLDLWRMEPTAGKEVNYFRYTLKNVRVVSIQPVHDFDPSVQKQGGMLDHMRIGLIAEEVVYAWLDGNKEYTDAWKQRA